MGGRGATSASGKASGNISFKPQRTDEITERLSNKKLLLSANTITIKDENGKTAGMVRNISRINTLNSRDMMTLHQINKSSGVDVRKFGMENIYKKDGNVYLLNNTKSDAFKLQMKKIYPDEYKRFTENKKQLKELENAGVYIVNYRN